MSGLGILSGWGIILCSPDNSFVTKRPSSLYITQHKLLYCCQLAEQLQKCRYLLTHERPPLYMVFCSVFGLIGIPSPPHPRASAVAGVVETLRGVGKQFRTAFLKVEKLAVRVVRAPWSKRTPVISADIHPLACAGKQLIAINEQVPEYAIRCVAAPCHPAPAAVLRTFHTVLLHIDTQQFPAQVYYLWHKFFRIYIVLSLAFIKDCVQYPLVCFSDSVAISRMVSAIGMAR